MLWDNIGKNELGIVRGVGVCVERNDPSGLGVATYIRYPNSGNVHSVYELHPDQARALAALLILAADLAEQRLP